MENKIIFDTERQMYVLTMEYVKEELGSEFIDDKTLAKRILKNSKVIYGYIYKAGNTNNRKLVDYILHKTDKGKEFMLDLLTSQMEADLEFGINSLADMPRVNLKTGQVYDKELMADGYLSQASKDIIDEASGRLDVNIFYASTFPASVWLRYRGLWE